MVTQSIDTNPKSEKIQIMILRKASIAHRFEQLSSLSSLTFYLSKRAIARANPGLDKKEIDLLFVKYHYGKDLADRLKNYLEQNYVK